MCQSINLYVLPENLVLKLIMTLLTAVRGAVRKLGGTVKELSQLQCPGRLQLAVRSGKQLLSEI